MENVLCLPSAEEALQLLIFEAVTHQALGPIHPSYPGLTEWGFALSGLSIHLWQKGAKDPTRPTGSHSRSFKDAEKRYSQLEKGQFIVHLALQEAERIVWQQPIVLRSPLKGYQICDVWNPSP